jgi:deoxyribonuclease-4
MSAGAGAIIGDTFEEIAKIIDATERRLSPSARGGAKSRSGEGGVGAIGICFDTCHAFASGYDLRTEKAVKDTFKKFDKILGLKRLKLIHANDSQTELGSHKDRHEHIGQGQIGLEGFKAIVKFAKKQKINLILETPHDKRLAEDLKILKKMRK